MRGKATNTTYEIDTVCPSDGESCVIRELENYGRPTGFLWCYEHAEVVGTITEAAA